MIKLTDLRGIESIRITVESQASGLLGTAIYRFAEISFSRHGAGTTRVEIRSVFKREAQRVLATVSTCGSVIG